MGLSDRNRCRHGAPGGCARCLFPDDAFEPFYTGTKIPRTPPSKMEIEMASSDVWTPDPPLRWLTKRER